MPRRNARKLNAKERCKNATMTRKMYLGMPRAVVETGRTRPQRLPLSNVQGLRRMRETAGVECVYYDLTFSKTHVDIPLLTGATSKGGGARTRCKSYVTSSPPHPIVSRVRHAS